MGEMERLVEIIASVGEVRDISADAPITDAGVDSILRLTLLVELESTYEVSIPDDDFIQARTPRELLALIRRLGQEEKQLCPA